MGDGQWGRMMNHARAALDAGTEVLEYVRAAPHPTPGGLSQRLDELAARMWPLQDDAYGKMPASVPQAILDVRAWRGIIGPRFPALGLYATTTLGTDDPTPRETSVGDAVDDLLDICRELEQEIALERATNEEQAAAHLCWSYWTHWGRHLRGLQLHLHDLLCERRPGHPYAAE